MSAESAALLADLIAASHFLFVLWVVLGLVLILVGGPCRWRWVRRPWVRIAHLASIGIVVLQAWVGVICPLTTWESRLRIAAGQDPLHPQGFIAHWVHQLMFFEAPAYVFTWCYTIFALLVVGSFFLVPIQWRRRG